MSEKKVVLSGIRATGRMHLGNYMGALRHQVDLTKDDGNDCFFFIADLHSMTTGFVPDDLRRNRESLALDFLASGLDPDRATLYCQSSVPEISQLAWLLSCLTGMNKLEGMSHWDEKRKKLIEDDEPVTAGLFTYPVLMAADILGPKANIVPVGDDQRQHVEFARELARAFNTRFGETFPEPKELVQEGGRVPGLQASGKMGKSEAEEGTVYLTDTLDSAWGKVRNAITDPQRKTKKDPGDPSVCNIYTLHSMLSTPEQIGWAYNGCRQATIGCIECKQTVFMHIEPILEQVQERRATFAAKGPNFVRELLHENGKRARARFATTLTEVQEKMGISPY